VIVGVEPGPKSRFKYGVILDKTFVYLREAAIKEQRQSLYKMLKKMGFTVDTSEALIQVQNLVDYLTPDKAITRVL